MSRHRSLLATSFGSPPPEEPEDANRTIQGLITRKDLRFLRERPYASKDLKGRLLVAAAIGCTGDFVERADELVTAGVDCFFVDIAHGHSTVLEVAIKELKQRFSDIPLEVLTKHF